MNRPAYPFLLSLLFFIFVAAAVIGAVTKYNGVTTATLTFGVGALLVAAALAIPWFRDRLLGPRQEFTNWLTSIENRIGMPGQGGAAATGVFAETESIKRSIDTLRADLSAVKVKTDKLP